MNKNEKPPQNAVVTAVLSLLTGLAVAIAVFGTVLLISNDMRVALAVGMVGLFVAALLLGRSRRAGSIWVPLAVGAPLSAVFAAMVLGELPGLWPHIAGWILAGTLGWLGAQTKTRRGKAAVLATTCVLALLSVWYATAYVPGEITRALTRLKNEPAPLVSLETLDGAPFEFASLEGKIVILDFFATWCAPCVAELPELEAFRSRVEGRGDVEILIVANDSGGDTPEAIRNFKQGRSVDLDFLYDPDGVAHRSFGFSGLPGLVVIDRTGNIRLIREGFNEAEGDLVSFLLDVVDSLP